MIVVDTNVVAYLYLPTEYTPLAEQLLLADPEWTAPLLWRSEFRNVLALYLRQRLLDFDSAYAIQTEAESLVAGREYDVGLWRCSDLLLTAAVPPMTASTSHWRSFWV